MCGIVGSQQKQADLVIHVETERECFCFSSGCTQSNDRHGNLCTQGQAQTWRFSFRRQKPLSFSFRFLLLYWWQG